MKKLLFTILSILAIGYIVCLSLNIVAAETAWNPAWVNSKWFELIIRFAGIAIIFCFALVNFAGSPLKTVFFILLILAVVGYVIVLASPSFVYKLFGGESSSAAVKLLF